MQKYSITTRIIHWLSALLVFFMFISGWYMVELDYYSPWYNHLPELHYTFGVVLMFIWLIKIIRLFTGHQKRLSPPVKPFERILSQITQSLFYLFIITLVTTGYLMMTAEGQAKILFQFIHLPALTQFSGQVVDTMGWIHEYGAYILMVFVALHVIGALKHHFIDKDDTLKRII
jgi:cytochrome b561